MFIGKRELFLLRRKSTKWRFFFDLYDVGSRIISIRKTIFFFKILTFITIITI